MGSSILRRTSWAMALGVLLVLVPGPGAAQVPSEWSSAGTDVRLVREGNTLLVHGLAPVRYSQVSDMLTALERPQSPAAMRLTRVAPGRLVDYFFCVTLEGRLVVGQQVWREDVARRWVFERGELARSYSPLESGGPWTWLIDVPLARESEATIVVRAEGEWPLRSVSINLLRTP
jgi:hypothetical protein